MDLLTPAFGTFFWQAITLLVVLLALSKFAWRPILAALKKRENHLNATLEAAKFAEEKVAQLESRSKTILQTAQRDGQKVIQEAIDAKKQLLIEAQQEAVTLREQMMEQTRQALMQEKSAAISEAREEIAAIAVAATKKLLGKELVVPGAQEDLLKDIMKAQ